MLPEKISNEINSPALKEISTSLVDVINRVKSGESDHRTASIEVAGHKHLIQTLALDWMYLAPKKKMIAVDS